LLPGAGRIAMRAEALHSFVPYGDDKANQLPLNVGDIVQVVKKDTSGWWAGHKEGGSQHGWFPAGIVRVLGGVSAAHNSTQQRLSAVADATSPASATVLSVWPGACTDDGRTVCQPSKMHDGPAIVPVPVAATAASNISHTIPATGFSESVEVNSTPKMANRRESSRAPHQVCTSPDPPRCASPGPVRFTRKQNSPHGSCRDTPMRRVTTPVAAREGPTRMATPSHRDVQRVASPLILSREAGMCASPKHLRRERQGTTTPAVKDNARKRVSSQTVRSNQRNCSPPSLETYSSPSVSKRLTRGVPVPVCQGGRQATVAAHPATDDVCRAVPSDGRSVPSQNSTRDASRKGDSKKAAVTPQCQTSLEANDVASRLERSQCLEEELECSRREWNRVAERTFQLEEELRNLRKEQEHTGLALQFLTGDRTVEVGQQLGRLQEDVKAKEKRLSKLEALLDGCEFAAVAERASDHIGVSVRELVDAIERRSSIGSPPPAQKHQKHQQVDQPHLMQTHQKEYQQDQSQEPQQQPQQSSSPWALTRPRLRHAAGGS